MELDIAFLAKVTGDERTTEHFLKASQARMKAFKSIFWNSEMGQWLDYWLNDSTCQVVLIKILQNRIKCKVQNLRVFVVSDSCLFLNSSPDSSF